jgi:uncharacterized protein YjbI with pentapeptide repeats
LLFVADLTRADLRNATAKQAWLPEAKLVRTQLQGANLSGAQLQGVNMRFAQLRGANLGGAQLQRANLLAAQLQDTNLVLAQLQDADLQGAQLQGSSLARAQLQRANMMGAQLRGANVAYAQLQAANLALADLQGAWLTNAELQGANLSGAQLQGADLRMAQLSGAILGQFRSNVGPIGSITSLELSDIRGANFSPAPSHFKASPEKQVLVSDPKNPVFADIPADWLIATPTPEYTKALVAFLANNLATDSSDIAEGIAQRAVWSTSEEQMPSVYAALACQLIANVGAGKVKIKRETEKGISDELQRRKIMCDKLKR